MQKIQRPIIYFLIFATMFVLGGIQNTKGLILEKVQTDINLDLSQVGIMVSVFQVGFLLASLVAGIFADRKGIKAVMTLGTILMIIGLIGTGSAYTVAFFLGFYLIVGVGIGSMTVSVATLIPTYFKERSGVVFNLANALFGVGMIVTPLVLNAIFSHNISWRAFYIGVAVVIAIILAALMMFKPEQGAATEGQDKVSLMSVARLFKDRQILYVILFILFYVAAEAGFLNFFPIFYTSLDIAGMDAAQKASTAAYIIASFAFLFTIGRFVGGFIIYKLGERRTLIGFSVFALLALILGRLLVVNASYLMMLFGLALSVLFPTAQGIASKLTKQAGSLQGVIYVASGLGGAVVGLLIGEISDAFGIQPGFNLIFVFTAIITVLAMLIRTPKQEETKTAA
ncbi:major facilitator transporter [Paenibacillus vortex V453]|uniref:Major facilitator transporter n=1 Tax=Paenibacillus vortex V453 TaxID=715225 RepID=A0A2R9SU62_9BACL|nr:MFS transporter [Paenibacillus vortex]EFU40900.1 major facilitator transporter [Paenibacillus vortex V453]